MELIADDGKVSNGGSVVTVTANMKVNANIAPIANAGVNQYVSVGTTVNLNGSASSDANDDKLTYAWTIISKPSGSTANLSASTTASPSFTADVAGNYVVGLTVNDGRVNSPQSTVVVNAITNTVSNNCTVSYCPPIVSTNFGKSSYVFSSETPSYALDLKNITYPDSYSVTAKPTQVNIDPCNLDITTASYPIVSLGSFPLPQIQGAPFDSNLIRGIALSDWWGKSNPTWTKGCKGDIKNEFIKTIDRLKKIGTEWIVVVPWTNIREKEDGTWYMAPQAEVSSILDEDLEFIVNTAHDAGIKIHWRNQLQAIETKNGLIPPEGTEINVKKFIPAYKAYMENRVNLFQRIGVDSMDIDCSFCWTYKMSQANWQDLWLPTLAEVATSIKKSYAGKTSIFINSYNFNEKYNDLLKNIDILNIHFNVQQFTQAEFSELSISNYRLKLASFRNFVKSLDSIGKTISFLFGVQPFKRHLIDMSYLEATQCTDITNWGFGSECIQRTIDPDFSVQAIAYEAILEEINSYKIKSNMMIFAGDYLLTDSLLPTDAFPSLHSSPRNKPAEGILMKWYKK